jgi:hypothetical protein
LNKERVGIIGVNIRPAMTDAGTCQPRRTLRGPGVAAHLLRTQRSLFKTWFPGCKILRK